MAKVHVEPEALRRFARDLTSFNLELRQLNARIQGRMNELEQSWRDPEQGKFSETFRQTAKVLDRFLETSEEHVQVLGRKAGHIEKYLQQR
jgi:uncharacterized protein YukE